MWCDYFATVAAQEVCSWALISPFFCRALLLCLASVLQDASSAFLRSVKTACRDSSSTVTAARIRFSPQHSQPAVKSTPTNSISRFRNCTFRVMLQIMSLPTGLSFEHIRHRPPHHLAGPRELVVACPAARNRVPHRGVHRLFHGHELGNLRDHHADRRAARICLR